MTKGSPVRSVYWILVVLSLTGCAGTQVVAPAQPTPSSMISEAAALAPLQTLGADQVWSVGDYSVRAACHAYLNEAAGQSAKLNLVDSGIGILSGGLSVVNPLAGVAGTLAQAFLSAYNASGIVPSTAAGIIVEKQLDEYEAGIEAAPPADPNMAMSEVDDLWFICSPGGIAQSMNSALEGAPVGLVGTTATSPAFMPRTVEMFHRRPIVTIYGR